MKLPNLSTLLTGAIALAVVAGLAVFLLGGEGTKTATLSFDRAISVYKGSDIRVLGVPVGSVDSVEPNGTTVKVEVSYPESVKLPEDATAVIVTPAVVGDRFIQMIPAYDGSGPVLADGAQLGVDRTAEPLELDDVYQGIDDLLVAIGPQGANAPGPDGEGPLSKLLANTADNLAGNGRKINQTITDITGLTTTLDNNKDALFDTVTQVQRFVKILADNDETVRQFNDSLQGAADLLEGERDDLAATLDNLGTALVEVRRFVQDNRGSLSSNIDSLQRLTRILVNERESLDSILTDAPLALNNLYLVYNPAAGTLDTRANLTQPFKMLLNNPIQGLCGILREQPGGDQLCNSIKGPLSQVTDALPLDDVSQLLPRAGVAAPDRPDQYGDATLAGIIGGGQ
ncbi:MCE family protein [Nocardioidaceae bacterium]|nr:MCE family protein [Nocardioidaceae bacterium]